MHILICPDSFKGSLSATAISDIIATTIKEIMPWATVSSLPLADGGEGTLDALLASMGGERIDCLCTDPLGRSITAAFGDLDGGTTAMIEMASTAGLELLSQEERNPLMTSTFGTGQMIGYALDAGFKKILVGIGGSSTNDGGAGMAQALGFNLTNARGAELSKGGGALNELNKISDEGKRPELDQVEFVVACDVNNTLTGPEGASSVYGPQKGATPQMVKRLDQNLAHLGGQWQKWLNKDVAKVPGAGAAGGMGAGLMAFLNAQCKKGFDMVSDATGLPEKIAQADLVITGEGHVDQQTLHGKVVQRVIQLADENSVPSLIVAGGTQLRKQDFGSTHLQKILTILDLANGTADAILKTEPYLRQIIERNLPLISSRL